uniref:Class I SAM-dependent methyltransferase n=1 Tax=Acrobeloides nanus TaxID=290746 RepID=A0A914E1A7_9BILA
MYEKVLGSNEKLDLKGWGSIDAFLNDFMENFTNIAGRNSIRIIEVGSYKGLSTVSLGKTCKKLQELYKKSCTVIAVDTWLDWIFIDADHDYEPVLSDIRRFYPLIHRGGILFGHDYDWNGVKKAVNEFVEMKKDGITFWISDVYWFIRKDFEDIEFFG